MDEILRNTFIAVLALSTGIHLWLARRHINFVSNHKNKVPDAFKKNITLKDHQKAAHYAIQKSKLGSKDTIVQASLLLLLTLGGRFMSWPAYFICCIVDATKCWGILVVLSMGSLEFI